MAKSPKSGTTPGGRSTSVMISAVSRPTDSGESAPSQTKEKSESPENSDKPPPHPNPSPNPSSSKISRKRPQFLATFNANSLLKIGKLKHLTDVLHENKILITAVQETRFSDDAPFETQGFRVLKSKTSKRILKGIPHLGTGFLVNTTILDSITDFAPISNRLSTLSFRCTNKGYTIVNAHAPINADNRKFPDIVDLFWEDLEETISQVPKQNTVILVGDFNAQIGSEKKFRNIVGEYPAHKRTNTNGERLINLCKSFNLVLKSTAFKHLPRKQKTWVSPNPALGEFQLDHVAISRKSTKEIQNVKVLRGANLDSDHYLSKIKVNFIPRNTRKTPQVLRLPRPDVEKLKNLREEFLEKLLISLPENLQELEKSMVQTALEIAPQTRRPKHPWWNSDCDAALFKRARTWHLWNSHKTQEKLDNFIAARKEAAKIFRGTRRSYLQSQASQIGADFAKNNSRSFYQTFKKCLTKYTPPSLNFTDPESGRLAHSDRDNSRILAQYFERLLNTDPPASTFTFDSPPTPNPDSSPPDLAEIRELIQSLKNNKAPGEDSIIAEYWKLADDSALAPLIETFRQIWHTSVIPRDWASALIHPLHKKGPKSDVNNYRGISLLPVTYKILSKALLHRAEPQLDPYLGEYQGGFRKSRSCTEQILNLKSVISYFRTRREHLYVTFIDFHKAYDSIDRLTLFKTLQEFGLDNKTREIVQSTLSETSSKVKFRSAISDPFPIRTGVRQGDGLSPLLFNCALEKVIREWRTELKSLSIPQGVCLGYKKDGLRIDCLAFADDLALLSHGPETAIAQIEILQECASKIGLQISFTKTQFISSNKFSPSTLATKYGNVSKVPYFKYLGERISTSARENPALESRISKMENAFQKTKNLYNKKSLSRNAKIRHYQTVIRPEALYAAECLSYRNKGNNTKLEKKERKIMRKILGPNFSEGINKPRANSEIYSYTENLSSVIRKRRLMFYGHVTRLPDSRLTKKILSFANNRKTLLPWHAECHKDLKELKIEQTDVYNRTFFKNKLKQSFQEKLPGARTSWPQERKDALSARMKIFWAQKKDAKLN